MELIDQVRERFRHDRFATENGAVIDEISDGYAKCSLDLQQLHMNATGTVMGGAIFTLADFAFAVASNWQGTIHVSRTSQVTYLGVAKGRRLIAEAHKVKEGFYTCYYLVEVNDELGTQVAQVTVDGFIKR